jgi:cytochrome P450
MTMTEHILPYTLQPDVAFDKLSHIPGRRGLPLLGITLDLYQDFYGTLTAHQKKYGYVSRAGIGFNTGLLVLGPDNFKQVLLDTERNFSNQMGYQSVTGQWFGGAILFRDFEEHRIHRRVFQNAFKSEAMRGYTDMMNGIMKTHLVQWQGKENFTFVPNIQSLLMNIGARVFYGVDDLGEDSDKMAEAFLKIFEKGMLALVKVKVPPFKYYYGMQGRDYIVNYLGSLIDARRSGEGKDFMSFLVKEKKDDGEYLTDQELIEHLSFLFFAAYDTTTTALSHLVMHLALDQPLQDRLREECRAMQKAQLDFDDFHALGSLDNAFHEALRLYPSASMFLRRTIRDCELGGYAVPANTILYLPPMYNHRMSEWWDQPDKFDPDRFTKGREEHKRHSFCYTPFGGGAHKCIGMNFAQLNAKLFMHQLLLNYRFRTPQGYVAKSQTLPLPKPVGNLPLVFERI